MRLVKLIVKAALPERVWASLRSRRDRAKLLWRLAGNFIYDYRRYARWSADRLMKSQTNLAALITMDYHRIEKALALRDPRPGFGGWFIPRLLENLCRYRGEYGSDRTARVAIDALDAYQRFNSDHGVSFESIVKLVVFPDSGRGPSMDSCAKGGTKSVSSQELRRDSIFELSRFFSSRHSVRDFSEEGVDLATIEKAVSMATFTPSVCNRQNWKVFVFTSAEDKRRVLAFQNGNRGFGEQANKVLVVTTDLQGERNQCWIDGGMFAMSLLYALHSMGVGTCCLNWSVKMETDQGMRAAAGIPDSHAVIMLIAVGHYPAHLRVAQSPRKQLGDIVVIR